MQPKHLAMFILRKQLNFKRFLSGSAGSDLTHKFFDESVQNSLKKLTGFDPDIVFRRRKYGEKPKVPENKFMTKEQYNQAMEEAMERGRQKLQMPPVLPPHKDEPKVLEEDQRLEGYLTSKIVFTDITYGKSDRDRVIVVRDTNGDLREATWSERCRMNALYFPRPGRTIWVPELFKEPNLGSLLSRQEYEFLLDKAAAQFEPDDPEYVRIVETVYEAVSSASDFNLLRSTRHYGPLVFYLVTKSRVDPLLLENFATDRLEDAAEVVRLYNHIHGGSSPHDDPLQLVKDYVENTSNDQLKLAFRSYADYLSQPKNQAVQPTS